MTLLGDLIFMFEKYKNFSLKTSFQVEIQVNTAGFGKRGSRVQIIYQSVRARGTPRVKPPPATQKISPTQAPQGYTMRPPALSGSKNQEIVRNQNVHQSQNVNYVAPQPTQMIPSNK